LVVVVVVAVDVRAGVVVVVRGSHVPSSWWLKRGQKGKGKKKGEGGGRERINEGKGTKK
jgi:hypothetical protein